MANRADNFNRADAGSLGTPSDGGSAWVDGGSIGAVASNKTTVNYGAGVQVLYLECGVADIRSEVTVVAAGASTTQSGGPAVRISDYQNGFYIACFAGTGDDRLLINKVEAGVASTIHTCSESFQVGDVVALEAEGTELRAYRNGNLVGTVTGQTFNQSVTKHGIGLGSSSHSVDDFSATELAAGVTTSPWYHNLQMAG